MRKKRSLLLTLVLALCLCTVAVCGVAFADDGAGSEPATPTAEDWSADETKWTVKNGVAFDDTLGMHLTAANGAYAATAAKSIGGNSTVVVEYDVNLSGGDHEWLVIKNTNDAPLISFDINANTGAAAEGNWIAIAFGQGLNFPLLECRNGQILKMNQSGLHCGEAWEAFHQKQRLTVTATDTASGVELTMSYDVFTDSAYVNKQTCTYKSDNKMLWGAYSMSIGRNGNGTIDLTSSPAATAKYKVNVTNVASDKTADATAPDLDPDNYAQDIKHWSKDGRVGSDVISDAFGLRFGGFETTYGYILDKNVRADSKVSLTMESRVNKAMPATAYIVFKNMSTTLDALAARSTTLENQPKTAAGTWMALVFGYGVNEWGTAGDVQLLECVDGTVTSTSITNQLYAGDAWYWYSQITKIDIQTVDNADGTVGVTITYKASDCSVPGMTLTGNTQTVTYTTHDNTKAFHGNSAFSVGARYDGGTPIYIHSLTSDKPLVLRRVNDGLCEFAADLKYWKNITSENNVYIDEDGLQVWNTQFAEAMLNQRVEAGKTVSLTVDGDMEKAPWGNMYFILNFDAPEFMMSNNSPVPAPKGNRMAIMAGGNGFRAYVSNGGEWESGEEEITGENIAGSGKDLGAGVTSTDFWYIYKQYTKFTFTLNVDEAEDEVSLTITLLGASGALKTVECRTNYTADDVADGFYFGVACFLGSECNGANGSVKIPTIKISGVAEGFVKEWNVEETQLAILAASQTAVTAANKAELQAQVAEWKALQAELNYEDGTKKFPYELLATVENNIKAYETDAAAADNVKTLIAEIPASITASNKADAESKVSAAETAYEALSAAAKAMVGDTEAAKITSARAAITAIEDRAAADAVLALIGAIPASITADNKADAESKVAAAETAYAALNAAAKAMVGDTEAAKITSARAAITALNDSQSGGDNQGDNNQGGDNQGGEEEDKGCGSNAAAVFPIAALALLGAAGVMIASKKRRA